MSNTLVSLKGVSKGLRGLNKVSENPPKNGHFDMFSLLTFTCLDQKENQQQRGMLLSKKKRKIYMSF